MKEFQDAHLNGIVNRWYPLVIDKECGGYFTNISYDWKILPEQEKMIVSQARHVWTLAKNSEYFGGKEYYDEMAFHGYKFLKQKMWDDRYGGLYQIRSREGTATDVNGWHDEKRMYGNAFGLYALAALYDRLHDSDVLEFAQKIFYWIEEHAFDPTDGGYFEFLTREGMPFNRSSSYRTISSDRDEVGFKDQNSSIHLLEAYTELYRVWKDPQLCSRMQSLLELIRDRMVDRRGYLHLFFQQDWTPVSFCHASEEERTANFGLDHISFGHDYETAFLMLEASYVLNLPNDTKTLAVAKTMLDHALAHGFDETVGGFFDGGYYVSSSEHCSIVKETKNWWAQAESLNALLLFSKIFPHESRYHTYFQKEWNYIKKYILDPVYGDWFEGGIDKEPHLKKGRKSHMWKCAYHTCRALMNCIAMMNETADADINHVIAHWRAISP
ncbi:MAG TPA: AGE family epimerase/isomerase [Bacteroidota bacterium]|nr:AGE family epimerase/isomerase [Bacteroidota bacterium]